MIRARARRFAVVGALAAALSLGMFMLALDAGATPTAATLLRLAVALPILYLGYSRWMLADLLARDRARMGRAAAEARMLARVAGAVSASALAKLLVEPVLTTWLAVRFGHDVARLSPLVGELGYGPLANWLVLTAGMRRLQLD